MHPAEKLSRWAAAVSGAALLLALGPGTTGSAGAMTSAGEPPSNRRPPRVLGIAQTGQVLQVDRGAWRRVRGAVFSYQWRVCDETGRTCSDVQGATDLVYPVRTSDAGHRLLVAVTATTEAGTATASSAPTRVVSAARAGAPVATAPPTIGGEPDVGSILVAQTGTWSGTEPIRLRLQWRRCGPQGGACAALRNQTQTYMLRPADAGHSFRLLVQAESSSGKGAALSAATPEVAGPTRPEPGTAPTNTSPPLISGGAIQGSTLTAATGSWEGTSPLSFSFQWRRCDTNGARCSSIARATQQTLIVARADAAHTIRVRVTARNRAGSGSAVSDHTAVVAGLEPPRNTSEPTISGDVRDGAVLTASPGTWRGRQPFGFSYQWLRCNARGRDCAAIRGATAASHTLSSADVGSRLRVRVTAGNADGSSAARSAPSTLVATRGIAPSNTAAPVLSGAPQQGARLTVSAGTWTGTQPISYSYRWMRCDRSVRNCAPVGGPTGNDYVLGRADAGHRLYAVVTAHNGAGSSTAASAATAVVVGAPVNDSPPTIAGAPVEGQTLTASPGAWTGLGAIGFGYQWTRCDANGEFSSCVPIVVTVQSTYTLRLADVGHRIFVQVKAHNGSGASYVDSAPTPVVAAAPIGTVTVWASHSIVLYGRSVTLTGRAVGTPSGEPVTIVVRPTAGKATIRAGAGVVARAGTWNFVARPRIRTTYRAEVRGHVSTLLTVRVKPRLSVRRTGRGRLALRIYAARSFAGRTAFLQKWNAKKRRWTTISRIHPRTARRAAAPTVVTSAVIRTKAPRGTRVRVVFPSRQAGSGYVTGISNLARI